MKSIFEKIIRDSVESIADGVLQELSHNNPSVTNPNNQANSPNNQANNPDTQANNQNTQVNIQNTQASSQNTQANSPNTQANSQNNLDTPILQQRNPTNEVKIEPDNINVDHETADGHRRSDTINDEYQQQECPDQKDDYEYDEYDEQHIRKIGMMNAYSRNLRLNIMVACAAAGLVLCMLILTSYKGDLPGEVVGIISTVSGIFGACLKDAYSFEFGSSRGSKDKDEKISATILRGLKR